VKRGFKTHAERIASETLVSLAMIVAFGTSLAATFGLFDVEVWWELASLITIMILGHWLEMRAISQRPWRSQCARRPPPGLGFRATVVKACPYVQLGQKPLAEERLPGLPAVISAQYN
jgi:hypothetical protein